MISEIESKLIKSSGVGVINEDEDADSDEEEKAEEDETDDLRETW